MSSNTVSHNTDSMRSWSKNMESNAGEYDMLINSLYTLIDQFVGSKEFSGGLASDLLTNLESYKGKFRSYSETFRSAAELISSRAKKIDDDDAMLKNRINSANPLG